MKPQLLTDAPTPADESSIYPLSKEQERTITTDGMDYEPKGPYQVRIQEILRSRGLHRYQSPAHIEVWMRQANGTLDHLSEEEFATAVDRAIHQVLFDHEGHSERLAASVGL